MQDWDVVSVLSNFAVDFESEGSRIVRVHGESSIDEASENDLAFCWYTGQKGVSLITNSKAGVILCKTEMRSLVHPNSNQLLIFTEPPPYICSRGQRNEAPRAVGWHLTTRSYFGKIQDRIWLLHWRLCCDWGQLFIRR